MEFSSHKIPPVQVPEDPVIMKIHIHKPIGIATMQKMQQQSCPGAVDFRFDSKIYNFRIYETYRL